VAGGTARARVDGPVSTPEFMTEIRGDLLDGDVDGKPGDFYVAILRGPGLDKPGLPFG